MFWRIYVYVLLIPHYLQNNCCSIRLLLFEIINQLLVKNIPVRRFFTFKCLSHISRWIHNLTSNWTFWIRVNYFTEFLQSLLKLCQVLEIKSQFSWRILIVLRIIKRSVISKFSWRIWVVKCCCLVHFIWFEWLFVVICSFKNVDSLRTKSIFQI